MTHNENDPSHKERLAYFDQDEATLVRLVLAEDPDFRAKAELIAETAAGERLAKAEREAESYAPYDTAKRQVIAELLLLMGEAPWRWKGTKAAVFSFANFDRPAVWGEDPSLEDIGARRVRERWDPLREGAQSLAWFGADRCIGCGKRLAERHYRGAWDRRSRRKHCEDCPEDPQESLRRRREANMRRAFDVLTGARQRHRAGRRVCN